MLLLGMDLQKIKPLESFMAKKSKQVETYTPPTSTVTSKVLTIKKLTMADRYRNAWKTIYDNLPEWRQKEVDNFSKDGRVLTSREKDFVQRVAVLAEHEPQTA